MGKKYIIDLNPDCVEGEYLRIPARIAGEEQWLVTKAALTPYTEPDFEQVRKEAYEKGWKEAEDHYEKGYNDGYDTGLSDAWDAAKKLEFGTDKGGIPASIIEEIFGTLIPNRVLRNFTASEAIEKIRQYEQEQENEFKVGDEFENESGKKFVVLKMNGKEIDRYVDDDGSTYHMNVKYRVMRKTGRHFPEIVAFLEKMRGENND